MAIERSIPVSEIERRLRDIQDRQRVLEIERKLLMDIRGAALPTATTTPKESSNSRGKKMAKTEAVRQVVRDSEFLLSRQQTIDRVCPLVESRPDTDQRKSVYTTISNLIGSGELIVNEHGCLGTKDESQEVNHESS